MSYQLGNQPMLMPSRWVVPRGAPPLLEGPAWRKPRVRTTRPMPRLSPMPRACGPAFEQILPIKPISQPFGSPAMGELAFSLKPPKWVRKMKPLKAIGKIVSVAAPFVPIIGPVLKPLTAVISRLPGVATATRLATGIATSAPVRSVSTLASRLREVKLTPAQKAALERAVQPAVTAATEMVGPPEPVATATLPSGEVVEAPVYSQAPSYDTVPAQAGSMPLPLLLGAGALALLLLGGKGRR